MDITEGLSIVQAKVSGYFDLRGAKITGQMALYRSSFSGNLQADSLIAKGDVYFGQSDFKGNIELPNSNITGDIVIRNSQIEGSLEADSINVGGKLAIYDRTSIGGQTIFRGAQTRNNLEIFNSSLRGYFDANSANIGSNMFIRDSEFFGNVDLNGARTRLSLEANRSRFSSIVSLESFTAGSYGFIRFSTMYDTFHIEAANFGSELQLNGTKFSKTAFFNNIKVANQIKLDDTIGTFFDLSGISAQSLSLRRVSWWCYGSTLWTDNSPSSKDLHKTHPATWPLGSEIWKNFSCENGKPEDIPALSLQNARLNVLRSTSGSWPPTLYLQGLHFDREDSLADTLYDKLYQRTSMEWIDWLARDRIFSVEPYTQLSSVFLAAGNRRIAEDIQIAGSDRDRDSSWSDGDWYYWFWMKLFGYTVGYGIGSYTFRVLIPIIILLVAGVIVGRFLSPIRKHSAYWWLFASLHRLLPVIGLGKEFDEHFNENGNLSRYQRLYFVIHTLSGWVLGGFLLAALGKLR